MSKLTRLLCGATAALFLMPMFVSADTVVFDDDFDPAFDYNVFWFNNSDPPEPDNNPDDISFAEATFTNGLPNDQMILSHNHDVERDDAGFPLEGDGVTTVQSYVINDDVFYNPSVEGAFTHVTFEFDYLTDDPDFGSAFSAFGQIGAGGSFRGFESVVSDGQWQTYSLTLSQSDLSAYDFSGESDVEFDFGLGLTSFFDASNGPAEFNISVDNFSVVLTSVPEPNSIAFLGLVGLATLTRRARKRN
jgi:hypothetical protein